MMFEGVLDPIFSPILNLPPLFGIIVISFIVTLIITIIYKMVTDQELMRTLKKDMKDMQAQLKKLKDNPKKMMEVQKKAMEKNMQYMTASMKPTFFTLIPILLIFGWLTSHLAYYPIVPGEEFEVTLEFAKDVTGEVNIEVPVNIRLLSNSVSNINMGKASFFLEGDSGDYNLVFDYNGEKFEKHVIITSEKEYAKVEKKISGSDLKMIKLSNEKIKPLNLFGWKIGWLGTYIIFSILFSTLLRKLLRLH